MLTERGDTVTENALMAAALHPGTTVIRNASSNYMVQDLCFFLQKLGVEVEGIGTTTLTVTGRADIDVDVDYAPSEDPIEAMSLLAAAIVTESEITIRRVPIEFLEIELALLEEMGFQLRPLRGVRRRQRPHPAGRPHHQALRRCTRRWTRSTRCRSPGLNIDNLPFFAVIAAVAEGQTLLHDWVYENRAIYLTELNKLGGQVKLLDPHRVMIEGPTHFSGAEIVCPPALRPAVVILLAMLASKGTSVLRSTYVIHRGYEDLAERLNQLGANIETVPRHLGEPVETVAQHRGTSVDRPDAPPPAARTRRLDPGSRGGLGGRRRGHVGGDPRQRRGVLAGVAVPVVLGLDQAAEVGARAGRRRGPRGTGVTVAVAERSARPSSAPHCGQVSSPCSDGTPP